MYAARYVFLSKSGARFTLLHEMEYVRSVPRLLSFRAGIFGGVLNNRQVYESSPMVRAGRPRMLVGTSMDGGSAAPGLDSIPVPILGPERPTPFLARSNNSTVSLAVPFVSYLNYYLDGSDGIWFGHGSEFRIIHAAIGGKELREIILEVAPAPVTAEDIQGWRDRVGDRFAARGGDMDLDRIPTNRPFFTDFFVDSGGQLWVLVPGDEGSTRLALFDQQGRFLGYVLLAGLEWAQSVFPIVRDDRLYIVGRDELEVERAYCLFP